MTRKLLDIAAELRELSDEELATVFYHALADRKLTEYPWLRGQHYFIGLAYQFDKSDDEAVEQWGDWQVTMIAKPDPDEYATMYRGDLHAGPDWGFCQEGTCAECGFDCGSNYKRGICPICGAKVYMS